MVPSFLLYGLYALFPVALAYAALSDLLTLTIPNRLVLAIAALFLVMAPLAGIGWSEFGFHLLAGAIVLAIGFALFALGWIGGGDAKLAAAVALVLGLDQMLAFIAQTSILGGLLTLSLLAFRRMPVPLLIYRQSWVQRLHSPTTGVPYGIAIAGAAALIYPHTVWSGMVG